MFIPSVQDAAASTDSPIANTPPPPNNDTETVRHMLFGSISAVRATIHRLHQLNYAEPNDWSTPISTGRANEVMAILTKRVRVDHPS
ncbi:MAG: hypothetical protein HLUCCA11_18415 [Phormidesmis priestleyi Ana]|uniref:Uncharacterized protein n=1 Tax=Phormidesmis priestleyi Ana TaxID=1666911 RepID=A0A0P7ZKU3_9CYAN|nr:MAG: hypothetical protein HLUCCA11_18415 [Phormidesmis priestleyi Ana]